MFFLKAWLNDSNRVLINVHVTVRVLIFAKLLKGTVRSGRK